MMTVNSAKRRGPGFCVKACRAVGVSCALIDDDCFTGVFSARLRNHTVSRDMSPVEVHAGLLLSPYTGVIPGLVVLYWVW